MEQPHLSISDLQLLTGLPRHVIDHAIRRHGPNPCGRVGIARIWRSDDLPRIRQSLEMTARVRESHQNEGGGDV